MSVPAGGAGGGGGLNDDNEKLDSIQFFADIVLSIQRANI